MDLKQTEVRLETRDPMSKYTYPDFGADADVRPLYTPTPPARVVDHGEDGEDGEDGDDGLFTYTGNSTSLSATDSDSDSNEDEHGDEGFRGGAGAEDLESTWSETPLSTLTSAGASASETPSESGSGSGSGSDGTEEELERIMLVTPDAETASHTDQYAGTGGLPLLTPLEDAAPEGGARHLREAFLLTPSDAENSGEDREDQYQDQDQDQDQDQGGLPRSTAGVRIYRAAAYDAVPPGGISVGVIEDDRGQHFEVGSGDSLREYRSAPGTSTSVAQHIDMRSHRSAARQLFSALGGSESQWTPAARDKVLVAVDDDDFPLAYVFQADSLPRTLGVLQRPRQFATHDRVTDGSDHLLDSRAIVEAVREYYGSSREFE